MKDTTKSMSSRRQFLAGILPACACACLMGRAGRVEAAPGNLRDKPQKEKHPFDQEYQGKPTHRQMMAMQYQNAVELAKALETHMGTESCLAFLKEFTRTKMLQYGKFQAARAGKNDLQSYVGQFKHPTAYKNALTKEVVEDTDRVFELKVTECIWADTFRSMQAAEIGYALVCWGDYAWAEGFNPKIKMVRDKTLMQGHECCNHRYIWSD